MSEGTGALVAVNRRPAARIRDLASPARIASATFSFPESVTGQQPRSERHGHACGSNATRSARDPDAIRPKLTPRPAEIGRMSGCEAQRPFERRRACARYGPRSPCRGQHRRGAVLPQAAAAGARITIEREARAPAADGRHCVGDQHRAAGAAQREAQHRRIDMHAIYDQPVPGTGRLQGGGDWTRGAAEQLRHGVEQVGETGESFGHGGAGLLIGGGR